MQQDIKKAIKVLKDGGIVIFPTDTTFVIGCKIDDKEVVKRLFEIRRRPQTQATPVLVNSIEIAQEYLEQIPNDVKDKLIKKYWPGALTVIYRCKLDRVPTLVRGGGDTLGVRMPNHPVPLELIKGIGLPILGPSANFHGERTPYMFSDLDPKLIGFVDFVISGETSLIRQPSTVIDCSQKPWKILRQGAIKIQNSIRQFGGQNYKEKTKDIVLIIDTASSEKVIVGLKINNREYRVEKKIDYRRAQAALPLIDQIIKEHKLQPSDIRKIEVNTGPGSFTGLRVGISVANALSFALKIPVNGKKEGEFVQALYE